MDLNSTHSSIAFIIMSTTILSTEHYQFCLLEVDFHLNYYLKIVRSNQLEVLESISVVLDLKTFIEIVVLLLVEPHQMI